MANPWLTHLSAFHKSHPGNSYKENMKLARASYTPISKEKSSKDKKQKPKQKGDGLYGAEAEAASKAVDAVAGVSNNVISSVQNDKKNNGRYQKSKFDKKTREVSRLLRLQARGKWPKMTPEQTLKYVEDNY